MRAAMNYNYLPLEPEKARFGSMRTEIAAVIPQSIVTQIKNKAISLPDRLDQLPHLDTFSQELQVDAALDLGLPVGQLKTNAKRTIFVQEYAQYEKYQDSGEEVLFGVSIRWLMDIEISSSNARLTSAPLVAASATFGYAKASVRFQVIGLNSQAIREAIPNPIDLTVERYEELALGLKRIKALMSEKDTIVTPRILAVKLSRPAIQKRKTILFWRNK
jgi:hypothetical protein